MSDFKQETLEQAAEYYGWLIKTNEFTDPVKANELVQSAIQDFKAGAKWQQEQMFLVMDKYTDDVMGGCNLTAKEWFEQNKINKIKCQV